MSDRFLREWLKECGFPQLLLASWVIMVSPAGILAVILAGTPLGVKRDCCLVPG